MKTLILTIGLLMVMITSSCTTTMINQKYPIIPLPDRPSISSELNEDDFKEMAKYAEKLEVSIKLYNEHATEQNKKIEEHFEKR